MAVFVVADVVSELGPPHLTIATSTVLPRLRAETRGEHEAVEKVLDLMSATLTHQNYRHQLEQFYGFYAPLEEALRARSNQLGSSSEQTTLSAAISAALAVRLNKTMHIQQDLQCLGVLTARLPLCRDLPPLGTWAEVLGCLYVMEGATLGGRLITQHVRAALGILPATGGSFFQGYGDDTGRMWKGMRQLLVEGSPDTETENSIVSNAIATFACLRNWCESFQNQPENGTTRHA